MLKLHPSTMVKIKLIPLKIVFCLTLVLILEPIVASSFGSVFAQTNGTSSEVINKVDKLPKRNNTTFSASGRISSLVYLTDVNKTSDLPSARKNILSGDWNLKVARGLVSNFTVTFSEALDSGMRWHTHKFFNFKTGNNTMIRLTPDKSVFIPGTFDIKLNGTVVWNKIKTTAVILRANTIVLVTDKGATGEHFRDQPIYGTVQSMKDEKGNEMK